MGRKKTKDLFIFQKDGQDWGPFTLQELVETALEGDVEASTILRNLSTKERVRADSIAEVAQAIKKYQERRARELELQQVEAEVVKLEHGSSRRKWVPVVIFVVLFVAAGVGAYFLFSPAQKAKRFSPRLMFRDLDLTRLKPLAISGISTASKKSGHKHRNSRSRRVRRLHLVHKWQAVTNLDFSASDSHNNRELAVKTIVSVKDRLGGLVSRCARSEAERNSMFRDAAASFLLERAGYAKLTGISSDSGVTRAFMNCLKTGARHIRFPAYGSNPKVITIPIKAARE